MKNDEVQIRKQNMKIYTLYRMLSIDHIFYYAIDFMFLTQIKHITPADIVLSTSFYALFMIILQIPAILLIDKLGNKKCMVLANLFLAIYVLLIINCNGLGMLILAQFMDAIGFSIKDTSDTSLLNSSIPQTSKKSEIFSKLEGNGLKNYYYFSAIASIISGFLYEINPYIPMVICFMISVWASIISLGFEEVKQKDITQEKVDIKLYVKDLYQAFRFIVKSNRLKALLLYSGIIWGIFCLISTYTTSLLKDIGAVASVIAVIAAIKEIAAGIGAKKQLAFHNRFKNKSLSMILIITLVSVFVIGVTGLLNISFMISIMIIIVCTISICIVKGVHGVLATRYLQNFTDEHILPKIYAVNSISRNIFRVVISFIGSYLLNVTNTANAIVILSVMFGLIVIGLITYMKTRVGLKPEDYTEIDLPKRHF